MVLQEVLSIITKGTPKHRVTWKLVGMRGKWFCLFTQPSKEGRLRLWVERRKEREIKSPSRPSSPLPHWLAVTDFGSAIYESLLKTHAVKLVFLHLEKFCQMP